MDMAKIVPSKPFLLIFYGFPGSGKTYFARQLADNIQLAHLQADRVRREIFDNPRYDKQENSVVNHLMNYMTEEFLSAGVSVAYDVNALRTSQRKKLYDLARKHKAQPVLIWLQVDQDTAYARNIKRDKRKADDRYAEGWDRSSFEQYISHMQNPANSENYIVVSGKHLFNMQQSAVVSRLRSTGIITQDEANQHMTKPGMVNLIPNGGRFDASRRNISIRS